jgi:septal ring factor EnvC (AmiA/AmiB activator)
MESLGQLLASEVFRGGALLAAVVTGITAITLQLLRTGPIREAQEHKARKDLDDSTQAELARLNERVDAEARRTDAAELRHAQCEKELSAVRSDFRGLEDTVTGLRRQLVQYEQTTVTMLRNREEAPTPAPAKGKTKP